MGISWRKVYRTGGLGILNSVCVCAFRVRMPFFGGFKGKPKGSPEKDTQMRHLNIFFVWCPKIGPRGQPKVGEPQFTPQMNMESKNPACLQETPFAASLPWGGGLSSILS